MIYSIPRGENVIARLWKDGNYDYILLVNMDKSKQVVNYSFKKPSANTCLEIMYGIKEEDIKQNNDNNQVTVSMPYIGVVWLRGYDKDGPCKEAIKVDPNDLPERFESNEDSNEDSNESSNVAMVVGLSLGGVVVVIGGILLFFYFTKKCCFKPEFNFKDSIKKLAPAKFY